MSNSMTKQHFEALANGLRESRPKLRVRRTSPTYKQWETCVQEIANVCRSYNSNFDMRRFLEASGWAD